MNGTSPRRPRLLFIHSGPTPPYHDPRRNGLYHLSEHFDGDLVTVSWDTGRYVRSRRAADREALGGFGYHATSSTRLPDLVRMVWEFCYYFVTGLTLSIRRGRYDAIVAYGPFKTAVAGLLVGFFTRAPLIVEVPGNPNRSFTFDSSLVSRIKRKLADWLLPFIFRSADHLHLLYPGQLGRLHRPAPARVSVFSDFVALGLLPQSVPPDDIVMFLGYPWMLKGVDLLIPAFRSIAARHPGTRLVIMGHCPDRSPFEALAEGDPAVEFHKAVSHEEAMALMARCRVFVLPSRTEAMGRVLLEAMAMGKPCVASSADGIPHYLRDEETGLIFETENVADLARQLDRVLSDPRLADRLGRRAREVALTAYGESAWRDNFTRMVYRTIGGGRTTVEWKGAETGRPVPVAPVP